MKEEGERVNQAIREEVFSGFCRTYNQAQTVTCEFEKKGDCLEMVEVDCGYKKCIHRGSCEIAKQIRRMEQEHKGAEGNKC